MVQSDTRRVVVMTGATSGFGTYTLQQIAGQPNTRVIIGARGTGRTAPPGVEIIPLDLASLTSVRDFADTVKRQLGDARVDILLLNAGIHGSDAGQRSAEGYGLTFAVNHLAHYLLARLLLPHIADNGRLVITSSNMHNPPIKRIAPKKLDLQEWAHPTENGSGTGIRSYTASKLCNLMTALSFARLEDVKARQINVIAFNPGLTGGVAPWSKANRHSPTLQSWREAGRLKTDYGARAQLWSDCQSTSTLDVTLSRTRTARVSLHIFLKQDEFVAPQRDTHENCSDRR